MVIFTALPGIPTNIVVVSTTKTTAHLKWKPPILDEEILGYNIEVMIAGKDEWYQANTDRIVALKYIVPDLIPNEEYCIRVSAVNSAGQGPPGTAHEKV